MTNNTERKAFEAIDAYFRSGNSVPVTRATIKLEEWEAVKAALSQREQVGEYDPANEQCPTCGYYCLGKGGIGCIDKPSMLSAAPAPSLCTAEEAAELAKGFDIGFWHGPRVSFSMEELAAIINADRAKR